MDDHEGKHLIAMIQSAVKEHVHWLLGLCASVGTKEIVADSEQCGISNMQRISASSSFASTFDEVMSLAVEEREERGGWGNFVYFF